MFDVAAVARLKRQQQRAQKGMRNHVVEEAQDDDRPTLTKRGAATTGVGWRTARARVKQSPRQWHRPVLRNNAPSWWLVPPHTASAADQFDVRHSSRSVRGERLLSRMHLDKASVPATRLPTPRAAEAFEEALFSVTSNRFVEPFVPHEERSNAKPPPRAGAVAPVERPWDLNDTLWKRRAAWCDGHGFFDSAKVKNAKMSKIFEGSLASGLAKYILKNDDGDSDDDDRYGQNGLNNDSSEVNDVRDEFGAYLDTFFGIFDVYAALDGDNIHQMGLNEWTELINDCKLADEKSKHCKMSDIVLQFFAVDGGGEAKDKSLDRSEFLTCITRLAVMKYVMPGIHADVSDAVEVIFAKDIKPKLDPGLFLSPDEFRADTLYTRDVTEALVRNEASMKLLFDAVASYTRISKLGLLLGLAEWKQLMRMLGLINLDVTDRDAVLCFIMSRMAVVDSESERGQIKESNLTFEGFLEAVARMSVLKAWPTEEDLLRSGCADAGVYMLKLRKDPEKFHELMLTRNVDWGCTPPLPKWQCVENMVMMMIRSVEHLLGTGSDDEKQPALDAREMKRFGQFWTKPNVKKVNKKK